MTGNIKRAIGAILAVALMLTASGCSTKEKLAHEKQPDTQTEDRTPGPVEDEYYDISSNLQLTVNGDTKTIDTDHLTITLSRGDSWDYTDDSNTSITIYNVAASEANCGGRLVTIKAYEADDKSYEILPSYSIIGEANGKMYIAEYPSDVQFDPADEKAAADYQAVFMEVNIIRAGAEDSPIRLK